MNVTKLFYRVCNTKTKQGLWYASGGDFTGLIHDKFSFCLNKDLPMPYDKDIVGWLSVTPTLEEIYAWFPKEDLIRLAEYDFFITVYEATEYKEYHNHWIISQQSSAVKQVLSNL